jgi:hypothetical protein
MTYQKINLMHVLLIGPLLTYIGFKGKNTPQIFYGALLGLTLLIGFLVRTPGFKLNYRNSISWVHWVVWSSLFLWISYKQSELPDYMFEIIKYLGIIVILVHVNILYKYYK